jgi:hypothetical protein
LATGLGCATFNIGRGRDQLHAGEGIVDITPPLNIELAGFHKTEGNERLIEGIRQGTAVRALVLAQGDTRVALVSMDIVGVSESTALRIANAVEQSTGIPAQHVRICATHTHSTPAFMYLRQWGAVPEGYRADVERKTVDAIAAAMHDLTPATCSVGQTQAVGGNFNRTVKGSKTDSDFDATASHDERWLDTVLQVIHFEREGDASDILWYHFSAHPVCYTDELAGPDWCGIVDDKVRAAYGLTPSLLQGHAGDVNPGDGDPWLGDPDQVATAVYEAIVRAMDARRVIESSELVSQSRRFSVPLDRERFASWLSAYQDDPDSCAEGEWVDAGFAKAWYDENKERDVSDLICDVRLSALRLGDVCLAFHPSELFSYYGLVIRHHSPATNTLLVGYTDGLIGYLTDPTSYEKGEYGAVVVPKILDIPPFTPGAAAALTDTMSDLIQETVG